MNDLSGVVYGLAAFFAVLIAAAVVANYMRRPQPQQKDREGLESSDCLSRAITLRQNTSVPAEAEELIHASRKRRDKYFAPYVAQVEDRLDMIDSDEVSSKPLPKQIVGRFHRVRHYKGHLVYNKFIRA